VTTNEQIGALITALGDMSESIRLIAHGRHEPTGLEALSMAVAGSNLEHPLGRAWENGCSELAAALREAGENLQAGLQAVATSISSLSTVGEQPPGPQNPPPPKFPQGGFGWPYSRPPH